AVPRMVVSSASSRFALAPSSSRSVSRNRSTQALTAAQLGPPWSRRWVSCARRASTRAISSFKASRFGSSSDCLYASSKLLGKYLLYLPCFQRLARGPRAALPLCILHRLLPRIAAWRHGAPLRVLAPQSRLPAVGMGHS